LRAIEDSAWAWHIGLDSESTAMLNGLWRGEEIEPGTLRRMLALFRLDFEDHAAMRADIAGKPVYMALSMNENGGCAMKPQNLLLNLPLALANVKRRKPTAPAYWIRAKRALARRDPVLAGIIRDHPRIALEPRGEPFFTLARSIVGQQISVKAAASIWARVVALAPRVLPGQLIDAGHASWSAAACRGARPEYLGGLARHFVEGSLHVAAWAGMEDEAVIAELVQVRGIGRWTAEMFLMFCLFAPQCAAAGRPGTAACHLSELFSGAVSVSLRTMRKIASVWEPWRSVATLVSLAQPRSIPVEY